MNKFQLYPPYSFWEVDFLYIFYKFNLSVVMATSHIERFWLKIIYLVDHAANISVKRLSICNEIAINLNFHFFHCESMETLSCHSN